ncbi:MAG: DNA repair protein RecO [Dehalococcoidia bacterium]|nr:DNA repair protein RecO [Dehalococcoidia bacterium]
MTSRTRVYKTEGVILRRRNLGEADSVFTVFSPGAGKFEAVARGVRKARSRMRGHLEPLTRTELLIARGRSLDVFTQAETIEAYRPLREDLDRSALAIYVAELIDRFTIEHAENPGLYELLLATFDALAAGAPAHVVRFFELHLLALTGFELQVDACASCGDRLPPADTLLAPSAGGLVCVACRAAAGTGRIVPVAGIKVLRYARGCGIDQFAALRIDPDLARLLQGALTDVIQHVLEREVVSRRHLDEVARLSRASIPNPGQDVQ